MEIFSQQSRAAEQLQERASQRLEHKAGNAILKTIGWQAQKIYHPWKLVRMASNATVINKTMRQE
jgi:hypothetical protein